MTAPVREKVLRNLTARDLNAFDSALSQSRKVGQDLEPAFAALKRQVTKIKELILNEELLKEILSDHPEWETIVNGWKDVALEDKIWLLELQELHSFGVSITEHCLKYLGEPGEGQELEKKLSIIRNIIDAFFSTSTNNLLKLLEPDTKNAILNGLSNIKELELSWRGLKKCPQSIYLLSRLETLLLFHNQLTSPPETRRFIHLKKLNIASNQLTAPPDLRCNVNLQILFLGSNKLTVAPDTSRNVNLQTLDLKKCESTKCHPILVLQVTVLYRFYSYNSVKWFFNFGV